MRLPGLYTSEPGKRGYRNLAGQPRPLILCPGTPFCYPIQKGCIPNMGAVPEVPMSTAIDAGNGKITVPDILARKSRPSFSSSNANPGKRIVCLTAYDYPTARLLDEAGVDIVLVGDSLGMVLLGYDSTLPVTVDEILHHTRAVRRGTQRALLVADMPYGSFHVSL